MRPLLLAVVIALAAGSSACRGTMQEEDLSDHATKARIESVLRGRTDLDLKFVTVDVNAGAATISGIVPNGDQLRVIRRLVARVRGVDHVLNNLIIQE
ncbi:MAG: BON domain-containing protein [Elusimicrobiota bacterium]|nr:BON domain-containing protein [Elusimicrobiota bacterium]